MSNLSYFTIHTDINMTVQDGTKEVRRTWRERFSNKFWIATTQVPNMVPSREFIVLQDEHKLVCHPSLKDWLEDHIESLI